MNSGSFRTFLQKLEEGFSVNVHYWDPTLGKSVWQVNSADKKALKSFCKHYGTLLGSTVTWTVLGNSIELYI